MMSGVFGLSDDMLERLHYCTVGEGYTVPCVCALGHNHPQWQHASTSDDG
jgi:hypothetical protein